MTDSGSDLLESEKDFMDELLSDDPLWKALVEIMTKPVEDPDKPSKVVP